MTVRGTVFISYSHDNAEHVVRVLKLSNRLRSDGVDTVLDQYETSPPEGWPRWMDREITKSQFVLMICTEGYARRLKGKVEKGVGLGAMWEGNVIYQHIYDSSSQNLKFIPVVLKDSDKQFIPTAVRGSTHYLVNKDEGYYALLSRLLGRPKAKKPPLGKIKPLPEKPVKTNVAMFISSPINIDLWNEAKWKATVFAEGHNYMPMLGIAFENKDKGEEIFEEWLEHIGLEDETEELRVSIIEGDIEGEEPGYTVHIIPSPERLLSKLVALGVDAEENLLTMVSRLNRMNPGPGSTGLAHFRDLVDSKNSYLLLPAWISEDQTKFKLMPELSIQKHEIHFRHVEDIGPNDVDRVVLTPPS